MTKDQFNALLLALFAAAGPVAKLLTTAFHMKDDTVSALLSALTILTPLISGGVFTYLQRPAGVVTSVSALSPEQQKEALSKVSDTAKVLIAEAAPGVATVVLKDGVTNGMAQLAADAAHPKIVTETQNEADAKKGTKV